MRQQRQENRTRLFGGQLFCAQGRTRASPLSRRELCRGRGLYHFWFSHGRCETGARFGRNESTGTFIGTWLCGGYLCQLFHCMWRSTLVAFFKMRVNHSPQLQKQSRQVRFWHLAWFAFLCLAGIIPSSRAMSTYFKMFYNNVLILEQTRVCSNGTLLGNGRNHTCSGLSCFVCVFLVRLVSKNASSVWKGSKN